MKKRTKIMIVLSIVSIICISVFGVGMAFMTDNGIIGSYGREVMLEDRMNLLMDRYSVWAVSDAGRNYNMDAIKHTNLHLGVVVSDKPDLKTAELADLKNYTIHNFDKNFNIETAHIFNTYVDEGTSFGYDMENIWGYANIWHEWDQDSTYTEMGMTGFYYDWMTKKLYVEGEDRVLYLFDGDYRVADYNIAYDDMENPDVTDYDLVAEESSDDYIDLQSCLNSKTHDEWIDPFMVLELPDYNFQIQLNEIVIIDDFALSERTVSKNVVTDIGGGMISIRMDAPELKKTYYYVVSYLNDPLVSNGDAAWDKKDLFLQANAIYNSLYDWKYVLIAAFALAVILTCVCVVYWFIKCIVLAVHLLGRIVLMWRLGIVLFGIFWLMVLLELADGAGAVLLLFLYLAVICPVIFYIGWQYKKQSKVCSELAKGNLEAKVDTRHMLWDMKVQGENINKIGQSITLAVDERMKSERMKAELITNVSHDIKTPLTSIINYVDLLGKEELENETAKEYIEVLNRQSDKLKKLIVDLIEVSKASTGNLEIHEEEVDVRMALMQVVGEYEEKIQDVGLELILNVPQDSVMIMADGRYLFRIFDNLMVNIKKYALCNTRAYIDLKVNENDVVIAFKNISRDILNVDGEEFTERFYRGDASRNTEGNGLGLAIVKSLVELMNGNVLVTVDGDLFKVEICFPKKQ